MLKARELKACTPWAEMARKGKKRRAPAEKRKSGLALFLWVLTIEAFLYELQCPGTDMLLPDELDAADEAYIDVWTVLPNHVVASEGQPPSLARGHPSECQSWREAQVPQVPQVPQEACVVRWPPSPSAWPLPPFSFRSP